MAPRNDCLNCRFFAFQNRFDAPVGEVPNPADHLGLPSDLTEGVPEEDALDIARDVDVRPRDSHAASCTGTSS